MKTIRIDFRKYPENPSIESNFELSEFQKRALESLPPEVDILNLEVEIEGHHILIERATSQYYNTKEHKLSNEIPMISEEIDDIIYHNYHENIDEWLTNRIQ